MITPPPNVPASETRGNAGRDAGLEHGPFLLHRNKGREHFEAHHYARARRNLELANRIRPDDAEVLYWLAMTYFRLDQHREAEVLFRRLVDAEPSVAALHVNLGIVQYKMSRPEQAEVEFRRALELDDSGNRAHLYMGLLEARRGDYRPALKHFEHAGAEVLAARMRTRLGEPPGSAPPRTAPARRAAHEHGPAAPHPAPRRAAAAPPSSGLAESLGVEPAGAPVRGEATFTPHGKYIVEVEFHKELRIRCGAIAGCAGAMQFVASGEEDELLAVRGEGRLFLVVEGRRLGVVSLSGDEAFHLEAGRFVACEGRLRPGLVSLGPAAAVALHGQGIVTMATGGAPLVIEVRPERPASVAAGLLVGWWGNLEPSLVPLGAMEDRAILGAAGAPKLQFQGRGHLLLDHGQEEGV